MRWTAPPDKRELTLILFSLTIFTLSYNLDQSFRFLGLDPAAPGSLRSRLGLGGGVGHKTIDKDGRKLPGWRDALETEIYGEWAWDVGHVAGDGAERSQAKDTGRHGALWLGRRETGEVAGKVFGHTTVDEGIKWWNEDVPQTTLVKHAPGYNIFDNVVVFNRTVYIVTDDETSIPPIESIVVTTGPGFNKWEILTTAQARQKLGGYGGMVRGVTWMSADISPHNSTLFSLWRTYSSLDPSIDSQGRTILPPPHRIFFPNIRFFTDANPPFEKHWIRRARVDTGFHPYLLKAAFPHLTVLYQEDWEDYHAMAVPFVLERIVVADRAAAAVSVHLGQPVFSPPFELAASGHWWEPVRRTLALYFDVYEAKAAKKVVTYLHRQGEGGGPRVADEDHAALVRALKKAERSYGYEVHIVSELTQETHWSEKMGAVVKSSVVLGVYGGGLFDGMFMKPSAHATLMEFFPADTYIRDQEFAAHALGIHYVAWLNGQKFTSDNLPPVSQSDSQIVRIDADAVVQAIHEALSRP